MSASRSVAAAQRRRAGPAEPQQQVRGPNTSINSSQVFNQPNTQQPMRPGTTGRIAGQQAAYAQQQYQQQVPNQNSKTSGSKMSIAQAITLITLRLGRIENKLVELDENQNQNHSFVNENGEVVDSNVIENIFQRLDQLEQQQINSNSNNNVQEELLTFKQQLESFKTSITSVRNTSTVYNKDIKVFKNDLEILKSDLIQTKFVVDQLKIIYNEKLNVVDENEQVDYIHGETENIIPDVINEQLILNQETLSFSENSFQQLSETESQIVLDLETELALESEQSFNENSSLKDIIQQELKQSGVSIGTNKRSGKSNNKR